MRGLTVRQNHAGCDAGSTSSSCISLTVTFSIYQQRMSLFGVACDSQICRIVLGMYLALWSIQVATVPGIAGTHLNR